MFVHSRVLVALWLRPLFLDYRLYSAAWFHGGFFHFGMNMIAMFQLGSTIEDALGTLTVLGLNMLFPLLVGLEYIFLEFMWSLIKKDDEPLYSCAVGYSGVLFALVVIEVALAIQRGERTRRIFGMCEVPVFFYPIVMLLVISIVLPNISFVGHLSGIIVGLLYVCGLLLFMTLPRSFLLSLQQRLPEWLLARPGWRQMGAENPFAVWHPSFCRANLCDCTAVTNFFRSLVPGRRAPPSHFGGAAGVGYRLGGPIANNAPQRSPHASAQIPSQQTSIRVQSSRLLQPTPTTSSVPLVERPPSPSQTRPADLSHSIAPPSPHYDGQPIGVPIGSTSSGGDYSQLAGEDIDRSEDIEAQLLNGKQTSDKQ